MYTNNIPSTQSIRSLMHQIYAWMMVALGITASVGYFIYTHRSLFTMLLGNPWITFLVIMGQFALVIVLSLWVMRMSFPTAAACFIAYSVLMGITFSAIFYSYSLSALTSTLAITAATFGTMAIYGYYTNRDLSTAGSFARMGLFGLIIALIVNLFWQNSTFDLIISLIGIGVFIILTAWDMQRLTRLSMQLQAENRGKRRIAIIGALILYLDFINLFILILNISGGRRK